MNSPTHFILDCDDVLLDWIGGFRHWLLGNTRVSVPMTNPTTWNLDEWLGIPTEHLIRRFNASADFGELEPVPGAVDAIKTLAHATKRNGCHFTVLTSCSDHPEAIELRRENLKDHFDDAFDRVICLALGESKSSWLKALRPGIWIEDNYKHALAGSYAGHRTFVMRRGHNREDERTSDESLTWVDDFAPIVSLFT